MLEINTEVQKINESDVVDVEKEAWRRWDIYIRAGQDLAIFRASHQNQGLSLQPTSPQDQLDPKIASKDNELYSLAVKAFEEYETYRSQHPFNLPMFGHRDNDEPIILREDKDSVTLRSQSRRDIRFDRYLKLT